MKPPPRRRYRYVLLVLLAMAGGSILRIRFDGRSSIVGIDDTAARKGLIYTCNCGWIDLGHARPDNVRENLWVPLRAGDSVGNAADSGFVISFGERVYGISRFGIARSYWIKHGLTHSEQESVALAIFMEVSKDFERYQWAWRPLNKSGFSAEDLVSDLISFYRAVRPGQDYLRICSPVSAAAARNVWDDAGGIDEHPDTAFHPFCYPCVQCATTSDSVITGVLPEVLRAIQPAFKGPLFRDYNVP